MLTNVTKQLEAFKVNATCSSCLKMQDNLLQKQLNAFKTNAMRSSCLKLQCNLLPSNWKSLKPMQNVLVALNCKIFYCKAIESL